MAYSTINDPSAYFQTKLFTGNGSTQSITNDGNSNLRPDWIWVKDRGSAFDHKLSDSERGSTYTLESNTDIAEYNDTNAVTSFNTDGFSLGNNANVNDNTANVVAWQWAAGGAAPTQTYRVVVVSDGGNKYRWRNSANSATFAQSAVTLDLQEGGTYTIDGSDSSVASHPIKLSTTADGTHGGGSSYNTGVVYKLDGATVTESAYVSGYSSASSRQLVITVAASAPTLYYYCHVHSGMGGQINTNSLFGSTNFDGTILSKVTANPTAGFSIVRFTTNGSGSQTVGHGLGVTPSLSIRKIRDTASDWFVHNTLIDGSMDFLKLNTTVGKSDSSLTAFSSTIIGVDSNTEDYVAYVFASVKGFSKFGIYKGNGNADGPFVYTGFKPRYFLLKNATVSSGTSGQHWQIADTKRHPLNPVDLILFAEDAATEGGSWSIKDFLSNGVKIRGNNYAMNTNNDTYIYLAFAESPLVATNNTVATAR